MVIKQKKNSFKEKLLNNLMNLKGNNPTCFWNAINEIKEFNNSNKQQTPSVSSTEWIKHFSALFNINSDAINHNSTTNQEVKETIKKHNNTSIINPDLDKDISEQEINSALKKIKTGKSPGPDAIINEMLKFSNPLLITCLKRLFNQILSNGVFPTEWNTSYLVPLHKSGNITDVNNYRGIALSNSISKVLNIIINNRLQLFLDNQNYMKNTQFGFQKHHRTRDSIFILKSLINKYVNKAGKSHLYACFVDLRKAFDSVWREGMLYKLLKAGVTGKVFNLIKSMYSVTKYAIKTAHGCTNSFSSSCGVKQGCNLSPLLFNIFINDLSDSILSNPVSLENNLFNCLLFADDIVIVSNSNNGLQNSLDSLNNYCNKWKLQVNTKKTQVIIFNKQGKFIDGDFYLGNNQIQIVNSYNYLGIVFQSSGNFKLAIENLVMKAQRAIGILKQTLNLHNHYLSLSNAIHMFKRSVLPMLMYGSEIWGAFTFKLHRANVEITSEKFIQKLFDDKTCFEQLHIKFCKTILGVHKKSSNIATRAELGSYPIIIDICRQMIRYHDRIVKDECNVLVHSAYNNESKSTGNTWTNFVRKLQENTKTNEIGHDADSFENKLKQKFIKDLWSPTLHKKENNKLRTYNNFKSEYSLEPYLEYVNNVKHRVAITKFRISAHKLPIEKLRYLQVPPEERLCMLCDDLAVGNEMHAFLDCRNPEIESARCKFMSVISMHKEFQSLPKQIMFKKLMNSKDSFIASSLGVYIHKILEMYANC
uniref:RNA-directed DNA polymerase from mobile element jockey-like n=1 Tax=Saccoglossus kowalevskii TaxID=10224 RepID=A0ABM0MB67_SACKO|nr:PREDICTED: RNA-directed DNA polymerase from mobile element jockey-like [Saccoglossus kowalevskii]